jgi:transcriptional regulator with PAS, ATPase and Fis domain
MDRLRIVGETRAMQELRKNIERAASLDCTVTLRGEPGSGKELAARAIHEGSMRRSDRFLAINCASFGSEQLAGQLLGYQSGNLPEAIRNPQRHFQQPVRWGRSFSTRLKRLPGNMQNQLLNASSTWSTATDPMVLRKQALISASLYPPA